MTLWRFWVPIEYLIYSLAESWYYAYIYRYKKAEGLISVEDMCAYLNINWSNVRVYKLWRNKIFSNKKAISQIEPFIQKLMSHILQIMKIYVNMVKKDIPEGVFKELGK